MLYKCGLTSINQQITVFSIAQPCLLKYSFEPFGSGLIVAALLSGVQLAGHTAIERKTGRNNINSFRFYR